jgi:Tetracyclin repressor-like, C-terminal domain
MTIQPPHIPEKARVEPGGGLSSGRLRIGEDEVPLADHVAAGEREGAWGELGAEERNPGSGHHRVLLDGDDRAGYLAMLELRLEATRRPGLRAELTETIRADLEANVAYDLGEGLPGDRETVVVLYLAMTGLIVEHLTLPDVLGPDAVGALVDAIVERIVPDGLRRAGNGP